VPAREVNMRVEEVMSKATGCRQGDTVQNCARMMKEQNIGFMPICDDQGKPVGAVTDRDLAIRVLADGRGANEKIDAFMTKEIVSCRMGDDVRDAERLMREQRKSRVMICDQQGKLQGVISLHDLAESTDDQSVGETVQRVKSDRPGAH
jgi:CBS domain-containing protein